MSTTPRSSQALHKTANTQPDHFARSREINEQLHSLIPGGAHTYAKGDDQYPVEMPVVIERGEGAKLWDVDGNEYIEYGMGLRAVTLGHAYPAVIEAVRRELGNGQNFSRPSRLELTAAEQFLTVVPKAEMVKFTKNGSDATTGAVKLARAATGREIIAICKDQPFFSIDDWFIGSTPMPRGIPKAVRDLTITFRYNDLASLEELFANYPNQIAGVMLEAEASTPPAEGFLLGVQSLCRKYGALFILDEMITGFRWHQQGAQTMYGLEPDLSTFGKGMANGFALAALVGKREFMSLGGIRHDSERVFLLSTTHGAEQSHLAGMLATLDVYRSEPVIATLWERGRALQSGIAAITTELGLVDHFGTMGKPCNLVYFTRDREKQPSQPLRTLFLQETLKRGLLMPSLVVCYSHTPEQIASTLEIIREALVVYCKALETGVENYLVGRPVKPVFRPLA